MYDDDLVQAVFITHARQGLGTPTIKTTLKGIPLNYDPATNFASSNVSKSSVVLTFGLHNTGRSDV